MKLAQIGTDRAVAELIRMAEGGAWTPPVRGRKHWYSLRKTEIIAGAYQFSSNDSWVAIDALASAGNPIALNYLREAISEITEGDLHGSVGMQAESGFVSYSCGLDFPKARGRLRADLRMISVSGDTVGFTFACAASDDEAAVESARWNAQKAMKNLSEFLQDGNDTGVGATTFRKIAAAIGVLARASSHPAEPDASADPGPS
jgi:hypothetical protein